jgi:hypothetical protein
LSEKVTCDNDTELTSKAMFFGSKAAGSTLGLIQLPQGMLECERVPIAGRGESGNQSMARAPQPRSPLTICHLLCAHGKWYQVENSHGRHRAKDEKKSILVMRFSKKLEP